MILTHEAVDEAETWPLAATALVGIVLAVALPQQWGRAHHHDKQPAAVRAVAPIRSGSVAGGSDQPNGSGGERPDSVGPAHPPPRTPMTQAGAETVVRAYFEELNRAMRTNDLSQLPKYWSPDCNCRWTAEMIRGQAKAHERLDGDLWTNVSARADRTFERRIIYVTMSADIPTRMVLNDNGSAQEDRSPAFTRQTLMLSYHGGRWLLVDMQCEEGCKAI